MRTRSKVLMFVGAGLVAAAGAAALLGQDDVKPIGRLSRDEVREVRAAVKRCFGPRWGWFRLASFRQWPTFVRMAWTFRVVDIRQHSIGTTTIHPDGTRDESGVTVWFTFSGWPTNACHVEKRNDRWMVIERQQSQHNLILFIPSNESWRPTPGFRRSVFRSSAARRGCAQR